MPPLTPQARKTLARHEKAITRAGEAFFALAGDCGLPAVVTTRQG
jgi:hypothetical protein